jgi:hypothetical protein
VTYPPPSGQDPYHGQGEPQQPGAGQGGWQMPPPEPTQQMPQPSQTQPLYPQAQPAPPDFYGQPGQPPQQPPQQPYPGQSYQGANPYAQPLPGQYPQQGEYPYGQPGQPGQPPYDYGYGAGYGAPPPNNAGSKNAMIAVVIAVALLAGGFSAYWFGFHDKNPKPSPIALGSTLPDSTAAPSDTGGTDTGAPSDSAAPSPTDTTAAQIAALQALMATMNDQGCKSAFQAIITFEQAAQTDAGNDTAIINDYDTAISSLEAAQNQAQNANAAAAIGQVVSDWKSYTAALAGGQTPDDSVLTTDGQTLAQACLAS